MAGQVFQKRPLPLSKFLCVQSMEGGSEDLAKRLGSIFSSPGAKPASRCVVSDDLRMKRVGPGYALLMIDIDHFKQVNDNYGHDTGDHVLKAVADVLEANVRSTDFVFRYGGEEFLVLLPATGLEGARVFGEKLRAAVEKHLFWSWMQVTISIGISVAQADDGDDHLAVSRADTALYRAKNAGRNQLQHC